MTADERNFRSTYYEKVGCRGVEEKKSLEILLKDKPLNRIKLKQFCLRFTVPGVHRSLLWNILLGVVPVFTDSHEYVMSQRRAVFDDLQRALKVMRIVDEKTSKARIFFAMWLLENKQLYLGLNINMESNFLTLTESLLQIFENDVESYWLAKGFFKFTQEISNEMPKLLDLTFNLLEKEDSALFKHFENIKVISALPTSKWYICCFSGILLEPALIRIWDKICGGSIKILVFVFIVLVTTLRRSILRHNELQGILETIDNIKEDQETADLIVTKAIELWQQNKGHNEFVIPRKEN